MESEVPKLSKSIFDIIEEQGSNPEEFRWTTDKSLFNYTEEEFLYSGELISFKNQTELMSKHKYVLTLSGLIKYKVIN